MRHIKNLLHAGHDVTAFDPQDAARAEARLAGATTTPTTAELWAQEPEVCIIASGTRQHVHLAAQAVEQGCHVFIEKPLSYRMEGIEALAERLEAQDLISMVGCNMRFHPGPQEVKARLTSGVIGTPLSARLHTGSYLPRWRPGQDHTKSYSADPEAGGAILDCIHELDLALWFLGPATLAASETLPGTSIGVPLEGLAELLLRHEQSISSIHLDFMEHDYRRSIVITGTKGTVSWRFQGPVETYDATGDLVHRADPPADWTLNDMYAAEMEHFLGAVRGDHAPMNTVREAARTLDLALQARGPS